MIQNSLRSPIFYTASVALAGLLIISAHGKSESAAKPPQVGGAPRVVVVELFTSEGCSSCPPAEALLKELSEQQPLVGVQVVALEEHVDYWNHLGWTDPYSSNEFSQRQNDYAQSLRSGNVYTPQMIVDGQAEIVGGRSQDAREAIQKAASLPKTEIALTAKVDSSPAKSSFEIQINDPNGVSAHNSFELWVALTEKGLQTDVRAGENSGETLRHAAVVRSLRRVDTLQNAGGYKREIQLSVNPKWKKENLAVVVFLTEKRSRKIIGVTMAGLSVAAASR
jgi:hypothetical protein